MKKVPPHLVLAALVRPLVRYCLRNGLRISDIEQEVSGQLVSEGSKLLSEMESEVSVSKLSVITGLNRPFITKMQRSAHSSTEPADNLTKIVGLWSKGERYRVKSKKQPRPLTYQGLTSEFAQLVAEVSKELNHYPILHELERLGIARLDGEHAHLVVQQYVPKGDASHGLKLLTLEIESLLHAIEANVTTRKENPHLHLTTSFDNIPPEKLEMLRQWILEKGLDFHQEMRSYLSTFDRDLSPISIGENDSLVDRGKVSVTSFSFSQEKREPQKIPPKKRGRKKLTK